MVLLQDERNSYRKFYPQIAHYFQENISLCSKKQGAVSAAPGRRQAVSAGRLRLAGKAATVAPSSRKMLTS